MIGMWARTMNVAAVAILAPRRKLCEAELRHHHFGLLSYRTLAQIAKEGAVKGLPVPEQAFCNMSEQVCDTCVRAKQVAASHSQSASRAVRPLALVRSDMMGPMDGSAGGQQGHYERY